jgi:hypothetical protein
LEGAAKRSARKEDANVGNQKGRLEMLLLLPL